MMSTSSALSRLALLVAAEARTNLSLSMSVTVGDVRGDLAPVPPNFVGLSIEWPAVAIMLADGGEHYKPPVDVSPKRSMLNLLHRLHDPMNAKHAANDDANPVVLRIGGNSADQSCWEYLASDADAATNGGLCHHNVTSAHMDFFRSFASSAQNEFGFNVTFVLNTNLAIGNPLRSIGAIQAMVGKGLFDDGIVKAIEIGNEPDSYISTHSDAGMRFYPGYEKGVARYLDSYHANASLPRHRLQGLTYASDWRPDTDLGIPHYMRRFADDLTSISIHMYPVIGCPILGKDRPKVRMENLLSRRSSAGEAKLLGVFARQAASNGLDFVVGETNSISCGGMWNLSDTMGSALWVLDYMSELSQHGVLGVNFHGGPMAAYDPISYNETEPGAPLIVRPMYYGMWMFTELVAGTARWHDISVQRHGFPFHGGNSAVHVASSNGELRVLVVAKEVGVHERTPIDVVVRIPSRIRMPRNPTAKLFKLQSSDDGVEGKSGFRFAGQTFDGSLDGLPSGDRSGEVVPLTLQHQDFVTVGPFTVPAATAALVSIVGVDQFDEVLV